jgi:hypothetical protein
MPKKKPTVKKVVQSLPTGVAHRRGVTFCPHCDYNDNEYASWHDGALMLVREIVFGKHGSVAVVAECPKCFKKSWVHESFSAFAVYDEYKEWHDVVEQIHAARHETALKRFCDSLCVSCVHLRGMKGDTLCWKKCTMGKDDKAVLPAGRKFYYDEGRPQQKCDAYLKREPIKTED